MRSPDELNFREITAKSKIMRYHRAINLAVSCGGRSTPFDSEKRLFTMLVRIKNKKIPRARCTMMITFRVPIATRCSGVLIEK